MPAGTEVTVALPAPSLLTLKVYWLSVNVAVTEVTAVTVTIQGPTPAQLPPDQPVNVEPVSATAVRETDESSTYSSVQSLPHAIPPGSDVTVPPPSPARVTDSEWEPGGLKLAMTDFAVSIVTTHEPVPEHTPDQPPKVELPMGEAVRVTSVPLAKSCVQSGLHDMPEGLEVTNPLPLPPRDTFKL